MKHKLNLVPAGCVPVETMYRNVDLCKALGLPEATWKQGRPALAVVGGGKSAADSLAELRAWPGDIWACGSTFQWLEREGIHATLFCVDPQAGLAGMAVGARKALLASNCDPSAFDVLKDAEVEVFHLVNDNVGVHHGPTTASAAFDLATKMGYLDQSYFGFDSSYQEGPVEQMPERYQIADPITHNHKAEKEPFLVRIVCDGKAFLTSAEFFMQAQWMALMFNSKVGEIGIIKNRSGGLLSAMINDPDYDCTHVSLRLAADLQEAA